MTVILNNELMRAIYPRGLASVMAAFVNKQDVMAEILATPERAALCFANLYAETGGLSLPGLSENIRAYTAKRIAQVWPRRFPNGASDVTSKYGTDGNWTSRAFDDIYGERMGNRPGTTDGSKYIGRAVPQITGRDGYREIGDRIGVDLVGNPIVATQTDLQPDITAAFWDWKNLSSYADRGDIVGGRRAWNGGSNGLDVVKQQYPRILRIISAGGKTAAPNVQLPKADIDVVLKRNQAMLIEMGYYEVGEDDGLIGGKTKGAIKAFNTDRGARLPSEATPEVYAEIARAYGEQPRFKRPVGPSRAYATEADIKGKVASVQPAQSAGFWSKVGAWFTGGTTVVSGAVKLLPDANDQASPYISIVQQFFPSVPQLVFFAVVAAIAIAIAIKVGKARTATVEDYQTGRIN